MRISNVEIRNFRGSRRTALSNCGSLNVLIGKNNSGKSTILEAISCVVEMASTSRGAISLDARLAHPSNFPKGTATGEVAVTTTFMLDDRESETLREAIASEAPQMRNALDQIFAGSVSLQLEAIGRSIPESHGLFRRLVLLSHFGEETTSHLLTEVGPRAAGELLTVAREARRLSDYLRGLEKFLDVDPTELLRYRERPSTRSLRSALVTLAPYNTGDDVLSEVSSAITSANDSASLKQRLESLAANATRELAETETFALKDSVRTFAGEAKSIPLYAITALGLIAAMKSLHLRDRREPVGANEAQRLLELKVRRGGTEALRNLQETVRDLMGVNIDAFEGDSARRAARRFGPTAEMDVDEILVEMNGSGIREALRLVLDNELSVPDVLFVEEPEVHLHPALEMSMLKYLQRASKRTQIFITTHSTNFLDTHDVRNVYLVSKSPDVIVEELDFDSAQSALPANLGLRLSSLFMYDSLVFVEGASDEAVLREFAATLGLNLGQAGVGFVHMGGIRNFGYFAAESTLSTLTRRRIPLFFIVDRDEMSDDDVLRFSERMGEGAVVHVLERREIENYLLAPQAVAAFIANAAANADVQRSIPAEARVGEEIQSAATGLKDATFARVAVRNFIKPLYFDLGAIMEPTEGNEGLRERAEKDAERLRAEMASRLASLGGDIAAAQTVFDTRWTGGELHMAPGALILDSVCQKYGVRYRKSRDAGPLAALVSRDRIAPEIETLLRSIVAA